MNQEILQKSLIQSQIEKDTKEVNKQLNMMVDGLNKMKTLFQGEYKVQNEQSKFIAENQQFLEKRVKPKIEELQLQLTSFEEKVKEMMNKQLQNADIKNYYEEFDTSMQRYYEFYKIIWTQVYYFVQRQRILLNKDAEKKQQLLFNFLQ